MQESKSSFIKLVDEEYSFQSFFNPKTGEYLRTGILDDDGRDTGRDPFMASFPHLLDVGIMGHCDHGISGRCSTAGNYCYQNGARIWQPNMLVQDFKNLVDQCEGKVFQFALGGRGDPDQHENFEEILSYSREKGIIPNMTTSGFQLDREKARLISQYCGASAVSWYKMEHTYRAIELLLEAGSKVNLHFVLSRNSIEEAIDMIEKERLPHGMNRIIFLLFKPVGQGRKADILDFDERTRYFFSLMDTPYGMAKMGFDSCCVPGVVNCTQIVDKDCYDPCESGRFSAYITHDLQILPCSFDQEHKWGVSLRRYSLEQAWNSSEFEAFRQLQRNACPRCEKREQCLGGCPIKPEITLCQEKEERCKP